MDLPCPKTNLAVSSMEFCQYRFDEVQIMGKCQQKNVWLFVNAMSMADSPVFDSKLCKKCSNSGFLSHYSPVFDEHDIRRGLGGGCRCGSSNGHPCGTSGSQGSGREKSP